MRAMTSTRSVLRLENTCGMTTCARKHVQVHAQSSVCFALALAYRLTCDRLACMYFVLML